MTVHIPPPVDTQSAVKADLKVASLDRSRDILKNAAVSLVALLLVTGTVFSGLGAQSSSRAAVQAKRAATAAAAQTAANHATGLQNNQILKNIEQAQINHASTINQIKAAEVDFDTQFSIAIHAICAGAPQSPVCIQVIKQINKIDQKNK